MEKPETEKERGRREIREVTKENREGKRKRRIPEGFKAGSKLGHDRAQCLYCMDTKTEAQRITLLELGFELTTSDSKHNFSEFLNGVCLCPAPEGSLEGSSNET